MPDALIVGGVRSYPCDAYEERAACRRPWPGTVEAVRARGCGKCEACGWRPPASLHADTLLHVHHVIPVCVRGPASLENLALLCPNCHALAQRLEAKTCRLHHWYRIGPESREQLFGRILQLRRDPDGARAALRADIDTLAAAVGSPHWDKRRGRLLGIPAPRATHEAAS